VPEPDKPVGELPVQVAIDGPEVVGTVMRSSRLEFGIEDEVVPRGVDLLIR